MSDIVLELPPPVSVNKTRRVNWASRSAVNDWRLQADRFVTVAKSRGEVRFDRLPRFELHIVMSEHHTNIDLDNGLKILIDYLHQREIVLNDARANLRKLTVEWGHAPTGCQVTVRPIT